MSSNCSTFITKDIAQNNSFYIKSLKSLFYITYTCIIFYIGVNVGIKLNKKYLKTCKKFKKGNSNISSEIIGDNRIYIIPKRPHQFRTTASNIQEQDIDDNYMSYSIPKDYTMTFYFQ
jgi:hypothetical protein